MLETFDGLGAEEVVRELISLINSVAHAAANRKGNADITPALATLPPRTDYRQIVQGLQERIANTTDRETLHGAISALAHLGEVGAIRECAEKGTGVDPELFLHDFREHCLHWLAVHALRGQRVRLPELDLFGTKMTAAASSPLFVIMSRNEPWSGSVRPSVGNWSAGTNCFAADRDPMTGRILVGVSGRDQLAVLDGDTLQPLKTIDFPGGGVRGVAVLPELRRAFVTTMYYQAIQIVDIDTLNVVGTIDNLPHRPERIAADRASGRIITGGLGDDLIWPMDYTYFRERDLARPTTGPRTRAAAVIDACSGRVEAILRTGRRPTAVAISPKVVVTGNFYDNTLSVFDRDRLKEPPVTISVSPVPEMGIDLPIQTRAGAQPEMLRKRMQSRCVEGIAIAEHRRMVLVTGYDLPVLSIVCLEKKAIDRVVPVGNCPFDVVVDAAEQFAYVACREGDISVVDLDRGIETARLANGRKSSDICLADDWVLIAHGDGLTVHRLDEE